MYIKELPMIHSDVDITWYGRHGVGLALRASADVLTPKDPPVVITFLISRALVCDLANFFSTSLRCFVFFSG